VNLSLFANFPVAVSLHAQHCRSDPGLTVTVLRFTRIEEFMSDTTQRLCTNHKCQISLVFGVYLHGECE